MTSAREFWPAGVIKAAKALLAAAIYVPLLREKVSFSRLQPSEVRALTLFFNKVCGSCHFLHFTPYQMNPIYWTLN